MPAVVGSNCDMALFHAEVDAGEPFGFLCEAKVKYGPPVTVHWEVYSDALGALSEVRHMSRKDLELCLIRIVLTFLTGCRPHSSTTTT
jgi:hypothetical protein